MFSKRIKNACAFSTASAMLFSGGLLAPCAYADGPADAIGHAEAAVEVVSAITAGETTASMQASGGSAQTAAITGNGVEALLVGSPAFESNTGEFLLSKKQTEDWHGRGEIVSGQIFATMYPQCSGRAYMDAFAKELGAGTKYQVIMEKETGASVIFDFSGISVDDALSHALASPFVKLAIPNMVFSESLEAISAFESAEKDWDVKELNLQQAWNMVPASHQKVTVAVIDSGVQADNKDFYDSAGNNRVLTGYNAADNSSNTAPLTAHGTEIASVISGIHNNGYGHDGVSIDASIYPIQVESWDASSAKFTTNLGVIANALDHLIAPGSDGSSVAEKLNIKVANISFASPNPANFTQMQALMDEHIKKVVDSDIAVVAAAGNADQGVVPFTTLPSDSQYTVSVISTSPGGTLSAFSNYNKPGETYKNISAPGEQISAAGPDNQESLVNGTSIASPQVSGLLALMAEYNPSMTMKELVDTMYSTATDLGAPGEDEKFGRGLINPVAALSEIDKFSELSKMTCQIDGVPYGDFAYTNTVYDFRVTQDTANHTVRLIPPAGWTADGAVYSDTTETPQSRAFPETGMHSASIDVVNDETGETKTYKFNWRWVEPVDLAAEQAQVAVADQAYTGLPLTPAPTVSIDGVTLNADVDYTVSYLNNVDEGLGTVLVTGIGNYTGQVSQTFRITKLQAGPPPNGGATKLQESSTGGSTQPTDSSEKQISKTGDARMVTVFSIGAVASIVGVAVMAARRKRR